MSGNKPSAPLPRDYDQASFSEMVPFRSKKIRLFKSPIFYFVAVTAIINVILFGLRVSVINGADVDARVASFDLLIHIALFYLLGLALLGFHSYAKSDKPITFYVFPCVFVYAFMNSPLWPLIYVPFDTLAGGDQSDSANFGARLWGAIAGPGLREELVKSLPTLFAAALTVWPANFKWLPPRLYTLLRVRSPLDGVLMGFAAGCAFLFSETGGQYVHNALRNSMKGSGGNLSGAFGDAMMLLLPRVMNGWVGHMAWAGIFGYFIGLAVIRPRQGWKLVLGGWAVVAVLHGLWDSDAPGGAYALYLIGGAGGLLAIACLVKARQLEASLFGRSTETFGSIVVGAPHAAVAPAPAPAAFAPAAVAPTPAPPRPAPLVQDTTRPAGLVLVVGATRLKLQGGAAFDLGADPSLAGRGQGVRAEITRHPTNPDVLGLKNLGATTWYARLRDNTVQPVEAQRSLRLAPGVSIDFGAGLVAQIVQG